MSCLIYRNLKFLKHVSLSNSRLMSVWLTGSLRRAHIITNGTARQPNSRRDGVRTKPKVVSTNNNTMKLTIAVEGCCHGELDKIYATLQLLEKREGKKIDLLICCGDFQAVRNLDDLETMACPPKYRSMQTFYKYYSGERVAPYPTVFIGGNHEAGNHLWELYYGGWAAPNIYFLGFSGSVKFGGLRIAGMSGIYKHHDYLRGHHESLPYSDNSIRSLYHIRDFEVYRLMQLQQPVDIFLSHDWPVGITRYGNEAKLLSRKVYLRSEVESGTLGSPPAALLLETLRPAYWFAAHMHVKFAALVQHTQHATAGSSQQPKQQEPKQQQPKQQQPPGLTGGVEHDACNNGGGGGGGGGAAARPSTGGFPSTRFLALDKCLPGRDFLQIIELEAPSELSGPPELHYDEEWLAILRTTHHLTNLGFKHTALPGMGGLRTGPRPEDMEFVRQALAARGTSRIPDNFAVTAVPYNPALAHVKGRMPQRHVRNPQTVALLDMLGLPYNLDHHDLGGGRVGAVMAAATAVIPSPSARAPRSLATSATRPQPQPPHREALKPWPRNPEEIDLEEEDDAAEKENEQQQQQQEGQQQQQEQSELLDAREGNVDTAALEGSGPVGVLTSAAPPLTTADDPMFQPLDL